MISDYHIEQTDEYYSQCAEQAYQDYIEDLYYEFLYWMEEDHIVSKTYTYTSDKNILGR